MTPLALEIVVAVDERLGIGRAGGLPWRSPVDMAHFRRLTLESGEAGSRNAVVMGRRTWESIPLAYRPLAGRVNVVLSGNQALALPPEVWRAEGLGSALAMLEASRHPVIHRVFVAGGAQVYAEALADPRCTTLHITRVAGDHGCDVAFPAFFEDAFACRSRSEVVTDGALRLRFERYARCTESG